MPWAPSRRSRADARNRRRFLSLAAARLGAVLLFAIPVFPGLSQAQVSINDPADCFQCHGTLEVISEFTEDATRLVVPEKTFMESMHGDLGCTSCHTDITDIPHESPLAKVDCSVCHDDVSTEYERGMHAAAVEGPKCVTCHGMHDIRSVTDTQALIYRTNQPQFCSQCHSNQELMEKYNIRMDHLVEQYLDTVHGKALLSGNRTAATCTDCHGAHYVAGPKEADSAINYFNIPQTCGKCHAEIKTAFEASIHGESLVRGNQDSPNCTTCHGEHTIQSATSERSFVSRANVARDTCSVCHASPRLKARYGIQTDSVESYLDSFHGKAARFGSNVAATCVDCHGVHKILSEHDPESTIAAVNLNRTCGQCHKDAGQLVTVGSIHRREGSSEHRAVQIVTWIYAFLITATIGGMLLHNFIILLYYYRINIRREREEGHPRFTTFEWLQHALLTVSFILLVITGMAVAYPDMSWVRLLVAMGIDNELRSAIHHIAGVVLLATGGLHVIYMLGTRMGRLKLRALLPSLNDLRYFIATMKFHLRLSTTKPHHSYFNYEEKAEYWALVWGTILMGITGFMLWFPMETRSLFPNWFWIVDLAEAIHLYEAWLATLAIIVWHFFFVFFHPEVYPSTFSWLTGKTLDPHRSDAVLEKDAQKTAETAVTQATEPTTEGKAPKKSQK